MRWWSPQFLFLIISALLICLGLYLFYKKFGFSTFFAEPTGRKEILFAVFGILVGWAVSFVSQTSYEFVKSYYEESRFRQSAKKLLAKDALTIFGTYNGIIEMRKLNPNMVAVADLNYWDHLKEYQDFLALGSDKEFAKIFDIFLLFEKINKNIDLARSGNKDYQAFSIVFTSEVLKDKSHEALLCEFKNVDDVDIKKVIKKLNCK